MKLKIIPAGCILYALASMEGTLHAQCASSESIHPVKVTFNSLTGNSSLVGFAELTDPSVPPRFYRRSDPSGTITGTGYIRYGNIVPDFSHTASATPVFYDVKGNKHLGTWYLLGDDGPLAKTYGSAFHVEFRTGFNWGQPGGMTLWPVSQPSSQTSIHFAEARRRRAYNASDAYLSVTGSITYTLSEEDTIADALAYAQDRGFSAPTEGSSPSAWITSQTGRNISGQTSEYTAYFEDLCPGSYNVITTFTQVPLSNPSATPRTVIETGAFQVPDDGRNMYAYLGAVPAEPGWITTFASIEARHASTCAGGRTAGSAQYSISSIDMNIHLGQINPVLPAGLLWVYADSITSEVYTPEVLHFHSSHSEVKVIRDDQDHLRQILTPETFVDIVPAGSGFDILVYTSEAADTLGDHDSNPATPDTYSLASGAELIASYEFRDPELSLPSLQIVDTFGTRIKTILYQYDSSTSTWILDEEDGLRITEKTYSTEGALDVETTVLRSGTSVAAKTVEKYQAFQNGDYSFRRLVQRIENPDATNGASLLTETHYYDDLIADEEAYGRIKQVVEPDGSWVRYICNTSTGERTEEIRGYLNEPAPSPTTAASTFRDDNRAVLYSYTTLADADGDSVAEAVTEKITKVLGNVTARELEIRWSSHAELHGRLFYDISFIRCATPAAAWDDSGNLATRVRFHLDGPFKDQEYWRLLPDGTAILTQRQNLYQDVLETITWEGVPDDPVNPTSIVDGTCTVEHLNQSGYLILREVYDISASGEFLIAAQYGDDYDHLNRPQRIIYLDGTETTRSYSCCGLEQETDREGNLTVTEADALGRPEYTTEFSDSSHPLVTHRVFDAADRVTQIWQGPDMLSLNLMQETVYNPAGEQIYQRERWLDDAPSTSRQTSFTRVFETSGFVTETTTLPNGATIEQLRYRDGSFYEITGPAARGNRTTYSLIQESGIWHSVTTETLLDASGDPTDEFTTTWSDFHGRVIRVERPSAANPSQLATETFAYNTAGQLIRQTDPDGIVTLFGYNDRGEQEVVAIDINQNDLIDHAGSDRITRRQTFYTTREHDSTSYTVLRTQTYSWEEDAQDTPSLISQSDQAVEALLRWDASYGLETFTETTINHAEATATTWVSQADGSHLQTVQEDGLQTSQVLFDSDDSLLSENTFAYDALRRMQSVTDSLGRVSTTTWYSDGRVKSSTTPDPDDGQSGSGYDSQTTQYAYTDDATNGTRTVTTFADARVQTEIFHPTGELQLVYGVSYPVSYTYDFAGRMKTMTTWQDFDPLNPGSATGAAVTTWNYNTAGLLQQKLYDDNEGPAYTHTAAGRLLTKTLARTDSSQNPIVVTYQYDFLQSSPVVFAGDLVEVDYGANTPETTNMLYTHYRDGRTETITDASGRRRMEYATGQVVLENYETGLFTGYSLARPLDAVGRPDSLTLEDGVATVYQTTYGYTDSTDEDRSRLQSITSGDTVYRYNHRPQTGQVAGLDFQSLTGTTRMKQTRIFDDLDRLESIYYEDGSTHELQRRTYLYDDANQRTRVTDEDGNYWSYSYDDLGQVESAVRYTSADVAIPGYGYGYTFDRIGNRTQTNTNSRTATWTSNALNQYTQMDVPGFIDVTGSDHPNAVVTLNGQATTRLDEWFHGAAAVANDSAPAWEELTVRSVLGGVVAEESGFAYLAEDPEVFIHDADGNLLQDGRWTYTWDAENRLVAMETLAAAVTTGAPKQKLEFFYDSQSRRFHKVIREDTGSGWEIVDERLFLYDGWNLIAELTPDQSELEVIRTYTWGLDLSESLQGAGGVAGLLAVEDYTYMETYYPLFDGNGNVLAYREAVTGDHVADFEYGAFGETLQMTGSNAEELNFRFSTKYTDNETDLVYYGYRYYDASTGRWLNRDPIEEEGGVNLYGFNFNQPTNHFDDLGHSPKVFLFVVVYQAGKFIIKQSAKGLAKHLANKKAKRCTALAAAVQTAKTVVNKLGGCKTTDCCDTLTAKEAAWIALVTAREALHKGCFNGGDAGHRKQVAQNNTSIRNCTQIIKKKCF